MTHDIRDALIDALRPVCVNPEVAADACLGVMERWTADEPESVTRIDWTFDKPIVAGPGKVVTIEIPYVRIE